MQPTNRLTNEIVDNITNEIKARINNEFPKLKTLIPFIDSSVEILYKEAEQCGDLNKVSVATIMMFQSIIDTAIASVEAYQITNALGKMFNLDPNDMDSAFGVSEGVNKEPVEVENIQDNVFRFPKNPTKH